MFEEFIKVPWEILKKGFSRLLKGNLTEDALLVTAIIVLFLSGNFLLGTLVYVIGILYEWSEKAVFNMEEQTGESAKAGKLVLLAAAVTFAVWVIVTSKQGNPQWQRGIICGVGVILISSTGSQEKIRKLILKKSLARAAKESLPVEKEEDLEILGVTTVAIFDKTGVITVGKPVVEEIIPVNMEDEEEILSLATSLEKGLYHPIGQAIEEEARKKDVPVWQAEEKNYWPGRGIKGKLKDEEFYLGSRRYIEEYLGSDIFRSLAGKELNHEYLYRRQREGKTLVFLAHKKGVCGIMVFKDEVRESSIEAITMIGTMGINALMLTGDSQETADAVSKRTGVTVTLANLLPEEKIKVIENLRKKGHIVTVAEKDSGVENADLIISGGDLMDFEKALRLGRNVTQAGRGFAAAIMIYNILAVFTAAGVFFPLIKIIISPLAAVMITGLFNLCLLLVANAVACKKII